MTDIIKIGERKIITFVAVTEEEQAQGLMFVKKPSNMTFIFSRKKIANFWMKNTYIPLDFLFVSDTKIVKLAQAAPLSKKVISSNLPCNLVIELPQGSIKRFNIDFLTKIDVLLSQKTLSKYYQLHYF